MSEDNKLVVAYIDSDDAESASSTSVDFDNETDFATGLREIDERAAWDSAYDAAMGALVSLGAPNGLQLEMRARLRDAIALTAAEHADAKLVERRKRWGGP